MTRRRLMDMFDEMVIEKDASSIPRYYHPDFVLETNGQQQGYRAFVEGHERVYATPISYAVRYVTDQISVMARKAAYFQPPFGRRPWYGVLRQWPHGPRQ